jgi:hypothetical protein
MRRASMVFSLLATTVVLAGLSSCGGEDTTATFSNNVVLIAGGLNIHEYRASCELYLP